MFFEMRTFGDIPGSMRQLQPGISDRPPIVLADPLALDQVRRLKFFQKCTDIGLAQTSQRSNLRFMRCSEPSQNPQHTNGIGFVSEVGWVKRRLDLRHRCIFCKGWISMWSEIPMILGSLSCRQIWRSASCASRSVASHANTTFPAHPPKPTDKHGVEPSSNDWRSSQQSVPGHKAAARPWRTGCT